MGKQEAGYGAININIDVLKLIASYFGDVTNIRLIST